MVVGVVETKIGEEGKKGETCGGGGYQCRRTLIGLELTEGDGIGLPTSAPNVDMNVVSTPRTPPGSTQSLLLPTVLLCPIAYSSSCFLATPSFLSIPRGRFDDFT
ncbi:hypothetical protein HispidOSU_010351 [Sigmodon hispidus]